MFLPRDQERNNNNDTEYQSYVKRRGASISRSDFNRQYSFNTGSREKSSKRNSALDPSKLETGQNGATKFMNFFKSGLHLSKFKSKSKMNLQEQRNSLYSGSISSKSEENLIGYEFDSHLPAIPVSNLILNAEDPNLYESTIDKYGEPVNISVVELDDGCVVQPAHASISNGQNYCFQIIKRQKPDTKLSQFYSMNVNKDSFEKSQIRKSCSYNSPFPDRQSASWNCESVNIFRCPSAVQRDSWIMRIKKHIDPNIEQSIRQEDVLKICIQEAKNLLPKKRYFCEIKLDEILYGRTTVKMMNDRVFWGEEFEFIGLGQVSSICVCLYRVVDVKRKRDKSELVAVMNLLCSEVHQNFFTEKWYSPSPDIYASSNHLRYSHSMSTKPINPSSSNHDENTKSVIDSTPTLRIKTRFRSLEIAPMPCYQPMIEYIMEDNIQLVMSLENHLKVKSKEEFVNTLLLILQKKKKHIEFLSDVVIMEILKSDDNLILRGNSMASKAMECYLKHIGEKYLSAILSNLVIQVTARQIDCEVDPLSIQNLKDQTVIINNQKKLLNLVDGVWTMIANSCHLLPEDLKSVFSMIREKLSKNGRSSSNSSPVIEQVISSCLFLRFVCPAIMSPFLFGLCDEYSDNPCINRTFTLVAKCIQSLANLSQSHHGKETYMTFLHEFIINKTSQMTNFLKQISSNKSPNELMSFQNSQYLRDFQNDLNSKIDVSMDLGFQLAELSYQLGFYLRDIKTEDTTLEKVRSILDSLPKMHRKSESKERDPFNHNNFRSLIPIPMYRTTSAVTMYLNNTDSKYAPLRSIESPPVQGNEGAEENFSYIPHNYSQYSPLCKDAQINENYVDFECMESRFYDDPCIDDQSPARTVVPTKCLNEKEINDHWNKFIIDSYDEIPKGDTRLYTINSSGYESLNLPSKVLPKPDVPKRELHRHSSQIVDRYSEHFKMTISPKTISAHQPNIYRHIRKHSNVNLIPNDRADIKVVDKAKLSTPDITLNRNPKGGIDGSMENLSGSDINSLQSSKSMSSVFQKKGSSNTQNKMHFEEDNYLCDSIGSRKNMKSSFSNLFRKNSQTFSNSISSNVDLDSFVSNELLRLHLFFQYYNVQKPSTYHGNAAEQAKCKSMDEKILLRMLDKQVPLNHRDIINHIMASYRLLKSINRPGQLSAAFIVKSIIQINGVIQTLIRERYQREQFEHANIESHTSSTQSWASPFARYDKQCPSVEGNSNSSSMKGIRVHDIFDQY